MLSTRKAKWTVYLEKVDLSRRSGSAIEFNAAGFCIISATFFFDARSPWLPLDPFLDSADFDTWPM